MVSIIILSYNTAELLHRCLSSIMKHIKGIDFEIIVVDNASKDETLLMLKRNFSSVKVIKNVKNLGFARGVNIGSLEAKGEFILLLNSDITFTDSKLTEMIEYARKHPDIAIVGGRLRNANNSSSKSFGKFYTLKEVYRMLFHERAIVDREIAEPTDVDWVSGGYILIRTEVFKKLGGFDEHFFMYLEDMELCYRAKKEKLRVVYYPDSEVVHIGQGSSNRTFAIVQIYKGLLYYYKKHGSFLEYAMVKGLLFIKAIGALFIGIVTQNTYLLKTYKKALLVTV